MQNLLIAVTAGLLVAMPPAAAEAQDTSYSQAFECEDQVDAGGLPGRERRLQRRMDRHDAKTDCVPVGEAPATTATETATAGTAASAANPSVESLCTQLAETKKLTGSERYAFIAECMSDSGVGTPATEPEPEQGAAEATDSADAEREQQCNELADRKRLSGSRRDQFIEMCTEGASGSSSRSGGGPEEMGRHRGGRLGR